VTLRARLDPAQGDAGVGADALDAAWAPLQAELHHTCLNDIPGLDNPTSEMLSSWLWARLAPVLPTLSRVTVKETASAGCHYDGAEYRIWKDQHLESALYLAQAPADDPRHRLHGHSYLLRLHLQAPLDQVMGWVLDFGDVKELFRPVYGQLDHHLLNDLTGVGTPKPGSIARWVRAQIEGPLPQVKRIDLMETPVSGVVLCWGDSEPGVEMVATESASCAMLE